MRLGLYTVLAMALESTWGTAVTRNTGLYLVDIDLKESPQIEPVGHLAAITDDSIVDDEFVQTKVDAGGSLTIEPAYDDGTVQLWAHALGAIATTGPTSTQYTHTATMDRDGLAGLTMEPVYPEADDSEVFEGCKINTLEFSCSASSLARMKCDVIAEKSGGMTGSAPTVTMPTAREPIRYSHAGQITWNSVGYDWTEFTLTVNRNLQRRPVQGSDYTGEPLPGGNMSVTVRMVIEWDSSAPYAALRAGTESDLTLTFTGTGDNSLAFTVHNARVVKADRPISGRGIVRQTVELRARISSGKSGLAVVCKNDSSTYTANG